MKYNTGDVVQLNSMWDNKYALILKADSDDCSPESILYFPVYLVRIQGDDYCGWISETTIVRKIE
jgi:hypothetical protein